MHRNGKICLPAQLFLHGFHDVVGHEGFAVVLADVPVGNEAGFAAQVAGKLSAVVVLHNDGVARVAQNVENSIAVQRNEPAYLQVIGRDALLAQQFAGLFDYALGRAPADQGDIGIGRPLQLGWWDRGRDALHLAHALFHHGAALDGVGVLVADQHAIFIVLIGGGGVSMAGHARNGARRNSALGNQVAFVSAVVFTSVAIAIGGGDKFAAINLRIEIQLLGINAEPALRQQQVAEHQPGTLEAVRNIEYFGNQREAIADIERSGDD